MTGTYCRSPVTSKPRPLPTPEEEEELLRLCRAGHPAAWKKLLARYHALLYAIPRRFGLDSDDSAEVYQNVCLALYRGLPRLKSARGITRWVMTTAHRQARDIARKRRRERPDPDGLLAGRLKDDAPALDDLLIEGERRSALRRGLEELDERCRKLLYWLYLEDPTPSYREIALRLSIPEGTIGPTRARCLTKLRSAMKKSTK